ncbi:GNAT family N-acetyltransferase [Catenulispora sp. GP43]|uniref:GNAT family N-acetyltransferase n=1 Tax=Catenulispora sp. GP43 TaxID=3156263 RepID=UPI003514A914
MIRELSIEHPDALSVVLPLFQAGMTADAPLYPTPTEDFARWFIVPRSVRHRVLAVAHDGERPVGYGLMQHDNDSNRDMIHTDIWIRPEDRAEATVPLLDAYRAHGRQRGCSRVLLAISEHADDYAAIFTAEGGRPVSTEFRSQLDLRAIDREQYAAWAAPSEKNAHYRIELWQAPTPEELLAPLVTALDAMRDAPTGDSGFQPPPPSTKRRRASEVDNLRGGARTYVAAALTEDGEIAGMHETLVFGDFRMADVGHTAVPARFRGHGLGLRLKAFLTLALLEREPKVDAVSTWNDSDNVPMLRVNGALGYARTEAWSNWQFDL